MIKIFKILFIYIFLLSALHAQEVVDFNRSVPLWLKYDEASAEASLQWLADENADEYEVFEIDYDSLSIRRIETMDGTSTEYDLGTLNIGQEYGYLIDKNNYGQGIITLGLELPITHKRGRCLIAIDDILTDPLSLEIEQLMEDMRMDGWEIDSIHAPRSQGVLELKERIIDWYIPDYVESQALFILGHLAVPYSGNTAHDGHGDHEGAWPADVFYGDVDGNWTDEVVDNNTPARNVNKNIPNDGKYDQTEIPSDIDIEIGRVDFQNLPVFDLNEIELTRNYLNKSHAFKAGENVYPRRALVENNFSNLIEGFGQCGWRNFSAMFGADSVSTQDYEVILDTDKYLWSYACGPGSYTACGGVGNITSLWKAKDIKTVFTMTFGSYFGDWNNRNNFLRGALASGDILTNAWAGRPVWQLYDMSLGKHIGYSARKTQNASSSIFRQGFSSRSAHIALLGDPTLRLHSMKRASELVATFDNGDIVLNWEESIDANEGYILYKSIDGQPWEVISTFIAANSYVDDCISANTDYSYMIKAIRLEQTGSGTYYNTSLGIETQISIAENPFLNDYFADNDMDGFGNPDESIQACDVSQGYVANNQDCDDTDASINPDAMDIANNGIDENCDGQDLLSNIYEPSSSGYELYPNPAKDIIYIKGDKIYELTYRMYNAQEQLVSYGLVNKSINVSSLHPGIYFIEILSPLDNLTRLHKHIIVR